MFPQATRLFGRTSGPARRVELVLRPYFGSPAVFLGTYQCLRGHCGRSVESWERRNMIVLPRRGMCIRHEGNESWVMDPASAHLMNQYQPYGVSHPCGCGDRGTAIHVPSEIVEDIVQAHDPSIVDRPDAPFRTATVPVTAAVSALHMAILREVVGDGSSTWTSDLLAIEEAALLLVEHLLVESAVHANERAGRRQPKRPHKRSDEESGLTEAVRVLLTDRLDEPLPLSEIGREVGCSPYHLSRVFRRDTGTSIHAYRTHLRLQRAMEYLLEGEQDLSLLAFRLGFSSHSHFTSVFRRLIGTSPSRFRDRGSTEDLHSLSTNLIVTDPSCE